MQRLESPTVFSLSTMESEKEGGARLDAIMKTTQRRLDKTINKQTQSKYKFEKKSPSSLAYPTLSVFLALLG